MYFEFFLFVVAVCRSQGSTFSCERLPLEYTPYLFCSGVVSYDFYVPVGVDSSSYDLQARDLAVAANSLLPTACLTDIKKLICATIYNPCVPNGKPDVVCFLLLNAYALPSC